MSARDFTKLASILSKPYEYTNEDGEIINDLANEDILNIVKKKYESGVSTVFTADLPIANSNATAGQVRAALDGESAD